MEEKLKNILSQHAATRLIIKGLRKSESRSRNLKIEFFIGSHDKMDLRAQRYNGSLRVGYRLKGVAICEQWKQTARRRLYKNGIPANHR